jgi:MoaA/NifB/PqqE/SkfB family radical SAM enzyme
MDNGRIEVGISLNNTCNLRCKMCRIWNLDEGENKLNFESCRRIIDELEGFDVKGVRLSGGEPLLTPWVTDLIRYISQKSYHTVTTTNGLMITGSLAKQILKSGLNNLNLSLDAYSSKVHDSIRGLPGGYKRIIRAIDYLTYQPSNLKIGINTVISNLNLDEIISLVEISQGDSRIDHIYFMALMQPFGTPPDREWFLKDEFRFLWPQDKDKTKTVLDQLIRLKEKKYKINNSFAQLRTFCDYFLDPLHFIRKNTCNLGREALEVNQLGDVYLCYDYESIGNIFSDSLHNIWNSKKAKQVRDRINNCRQNCNLLINCYFEEDV